MYKKSDSARNLQIRDKVLSKELFIKETFPLKFFYLIKEYKESRQISKKAAFKFLGKYEMRENCSTVQFFQEKFVSV